jgi:DNA-binding Lrp family transcriptional regulator
MALVGRQNLATAFVLVNTELGSESEISESLKEIPEVKETYMVYGVNDIITRVETDTMEDLKIIMWRIRHLNKVRSTVSLICFDPRGGI